MTFFGSELASETVNRLRRLVGLPGRGIRPSQGHNTKKPCTYIHAPSGIQTQDPRVRTVQDSTDRDSAARYQP